MKKITIYSIVFVGLFCWLSPVYAANNVAISPIISLLLGDDNECRKLSTFIGDVEPGDTSCVDCFWQEKITCYSSKTSASFITPGIASISWNQMAAYCKSMCDGWESKNTFDRALGGDPASGFVMILTPSVAVP